MVKIGCSGCLLVRQSFFLDDSRMFTDVGGGVTGVRGLHSSFHPTLDGLTLNMGITLLVFSFSHMVACFVSHALGEIMLLIYLSQMYQQP